MTYYKQIDSFRFFAAFAVLTAHWLHHYPIIDDLKLGFIGVDFFFVVSGFLISFQLFELSRSIKQKKIGYLKGLSNFIFRRALRIFPLYYLILILGTAFNTGAIRDAFIYNLFYASNFYFIDVQKWASTFSHFWSLSVEEHFYLVWPVVILAVRKKFIPFLILLVAGSSVAFRYFIFINTHDYLSVHIHTLACLDVFMFGAGLAYVLFKYKEQFMAFFSNRIIKNSIVLTFLLSYGAVILFKEQPLFVWVFFRSLFGICCAGIVGLLAIGFKGMASKIFENKWLILGGKLSYGIYLLHNFVPGMLLGIKKFGLSVALEFLIYFIVTVLLSLLLHTIIEKPIRKLGTRFRISFTEK